MTQLLKGKPVADAISLSVQAEAESLKKRGVRPTLAIVRVGAREDDVAYENAALRRCQSNGVDAVLRSLPAEASQEALLAVIEELNADPAVHGVLLFRPLPRHMDETLICNALAPEKDIDGVTEASMAGVYAGTDTGHPPCTAMAAMALLEHYGFAPEGRRAVVVGRSTVIGRPAALMLLQRNATVTICHTRTKDLPAVCREAEILVVAAGKARMAGPEFTNPDQVVIDVGIHADPEGGLCGDVDFSRVEPVVKAISPVPAGVGSVTTAILTLHVVQAAARTL
ncbi:MAG: bifunctional 5,10-methylenetetrahydrofolate dehydrogenase/5,10-methenyltetrahydrofolate cyclohydrolase [Bacillota bacterium]|nr:bifunctional 5,10-methylenetetrahydrofolate dehydrogenase/5,10-methenyltetrahydrofolate cyclohydrolase [Bacillota bacterium]